jgi:type I restriction enzyme M protein
MLTIENLPVALTALGFKAKGQRYSKTIGTTTLQVLLDTQEIVYPESDGLVINERQTCNFSSNENFVVLECVHRLLTKGYKPEHIELEPKWQLGRGSSGGRADILVKDNQGRPLLIIECKTAGTEFRRAWTKTQLDGDQLFSYAQQISETQFLCLYTVDFDNGALRYTSLIVAHRDNPRYLADNPLFKGFHTATDVKERHAVWRDTYKLDYTTKGLFEDNIQPYHIGKNKYTLDDLHAISAADQQSKYHEYATILRQHNVSGRENAFDKLVNLFLCKLVDEIENPGDLKFYWKGVAYDTHFELLDRLQQLYQSGMARFLGESITYINQNDVNNALRFVRQNPDATQRAVWNLFVQQKFFTNNDFSLIDVHNEKLFYQNAEVLLRILQMWQDIRLSNPGSHNQFLGDMFEGFLDQGVKQSEGQYFTPMPICRFILMSLPLESLVKNSATPPKAIDYACGAGHFLNELALQLQPLVEKHKQADMAAYHKAIHGIEKEYRLSKVAKVSAFMYGQQEINICYGDALVKEHAAYPEIQDGTFDLLVANPPFSVRGFLETLPEADRAAYTLTDTVDKLDTNNSIETFFLERAKQLLKPGGVAGIILPSSVLSNANGTYIRAREILLQYFDIVAIVEFGSGTFGKTGTNTVTLFLRRKPTAPDTAAHYRDRLEEWFSADESQAVYRDAHLIDAYAAHIGVPVADYKGLLQGDAQGAWADHDHFEQYKKKFNDSSEVDRLSKQRAFKALSADDKEKELRKRFLSFSQEIERDKLYHFVMASDQKSPVLIVRGPTDSKAQKRFLGYEWSAAKGDEGIKLIRDSIGRHQTLLYDEGRRDNAAKINQLIAENFSGNRIDFTEELAAVCSYTRLVDLLAFGRPAMDKALGLDAKSTPFAVVDSSMRPLSEVAFIEKGVTYTKPDQVGSETTNVVLTADNVTLDGRLRVVKRVYLRDDLSLPVSKQLREGDIFICMSSGSREHVGKVSYVEKSEGFFAGGLHGHPACKAWGQLASSL